MRHGRCHDHDDVRGANGFGKVGGGEFDSAETVHRTVHLNALLTANRFDRLRNDVVESDGKPHQGQVAGQRLPAVAAPDNGPSGFAPWMG